MPRRIAHVFSGPGRRPDGLRQTLLALYGHDCVEFDTIIHESEGNILNDEVFQELLARVSSGEFAVVIIGTPCSTFTVARIPKHGVDDGGPAQLRDRDRPHGRRGLSEKDQQILKDSNELVRRSVLLARAAKAAGGEFIIENPATRSDKNSDLYRWMWRSHASLWMHELVAALAKEKWSRYVTFPQCALGSEFQKYTTLLYSVGLDKAIGPLDSLTCSHKRHAKQAVGLDDEGKWRSADSAAYPFEMNVRLAAACAMKLRPIALRVGSRKPHAEEECMECEVAAKQAPPTTSLRRLEHELQEVLQSEALPASNASPVTDWAEAPAPAQSVPGPFTTDQLMPSIMQSRLRQFATDVHACFHAARRGRWKWARDHRPEALHATEEQCLHECGRGWVWAYSDTDSLWHAVQPSGWPEDPPASELNTAMIVQYARDNGFSDMEIIAFIAHGYPGPDLERCAVIGPPHVGALKEPVAFDKAAAKDRSKGWVRHGYRLPPIWPMRADPMNILMRNGKGRMTIDKTITLVWGVTSYNDCIDLDSQPAIDYVSVSMLGRGAAILRTANAPVALWGFDLEAYFRKTGKQRAHVWMSGFVHGDGYGADERVQFGQKEAPVLCGRQSCFLIWAIRREIARADAEHPTRHAGIREWLQRRKESADAQDATWQWEALSFVLMYVDDVGAVSFVDELFNKDGSEMWGEQEGAMCRMTRAMLHMQAALYVMSQFGHVDSIDKRCYPGLHMVFLGVTIDLRDNTLSLSKDKADAYRGEVLSVLDVHTQSNGTKLVQPALISSLMHKLLHAASVMPLGRQHLFYVLRCMKQDAQMHGGANIFEPWYTTRVSLVGGVVEARGSHARRAASFSYDVPRSFRPSRPCSLLGRLEREGVTHREWIWRVGGDRRDHLLRGGAMDGCGGRSDRYQHARARGHEHRLLHVPAGGGAEGTQD